MVSDQATKLPRRLIQLFTISVTKLAARKCSSLEQTDCVQKNSLTVDARYDVAPNPSDRFRKRDRAIQKF